MTHKIDYLSILFCRDRPIDLFFNRSSFMVHKNDTLSHYEITMYIRGFGCNSSPTKLCNLSYKGILIIQDLVLYRCKYRTFIHASFSLKIVIT